MSNIKNISRRSIVIVYTLLLPFFSAVSTANAQETDASEWIFTIGAAGIASSSPWTGSDIQSKLTPFFQARKDNWRFGGESLVSYQAEITDQWSLAIGIDSRSDGYRRSFDGGRVFSSYETPDREVVANLSLSYGKFSVGAIQDLSSNSESTAVSISYKIPVYRSQNGLLITMDTAALWYSSDYVNYHYGVADQQVDESVGRFAYEGDSAVNLKLGISALYRINQNWAIFSFLNQTHLNENITDSPLIDEDYRRTAAVILVYQF